MSARETAQETPPERLLEWLRSLEVVGCVRVEARHFTAGSEAATVVATWDIAEREDGGERFDGPAIFRRLEEDAQEVGGVQRYQLLAFREGAKHPRETMKLRIDGGADGDASTSEPANAHGLVAQAHRHNEALMGMMVRGFGQAMHTLSEQNKFLSRQLERSDERRVEMWATLDEMAKHDKDRETHKHSLKLQEQRNDVLKDSVKLLMPGLLTKFGLGSNTANEEGFVRLLESFTDEQREKVFMLLTPDQQIALAALLDNRIKKDTNGKKVEATP